MSLLDELDSILRGATRYADYVASLCPFHDDSRPSFIVHEETYMCYSCGAFGRTEELIKQLSGNVVLKKKPSFYNPFTGWLKKESLYTALKKSYNTLKENPSVYLRDRGIPPKVQIKLGMGLRDGWITFPITDLSNKLIGAVARVGYNAVDVPSKYIVPKGQSPDLPYTPSWKAVVEGKQVFLTFGILDAVTLYMYGEGAMSTTNGKRINPKALIDIRKPILVVPDLGEEREALHLMASLDWRGRLLQMAYPEGCKDVNDVHQLNPEIIKQGLEVINGSRLAVVK